MRKLTGSLIPGIILISVLLIIFITLSISHIRSENSELNIAEVNKFNSDLVDNDKDTLIYNKDLSKKKLFIAYSGYSES